MLTRLQELAGIKEISINKPKLNNKLLCDLLNNNKSEAINTLSAFFHYAEDIHDPETEVYFMLGDWNLYEIVYCEVAGDGIGWEASLNLEDIEDEADGQAEISEVNFKGVKFYQAEYNI